MKKNLQRLGSTLADRMKKTAGAAALITAEMGTINRDMSLSVDSVKKAIPKGDYMINISLSSSSYNTSSESHTHDGGLLIGTIDGGSHSHRLPSVFRALKAGDRVLVIWCGFEPIVVSIITQS